MVELLRKGFCFSLARRWWQSVEIPLLGHTPVPYIGAPDVFPQTLGGKGYHMAMNRKDGCTTMEPSMAEKTCCWQVKPASILDDGLVVEGIVVRPTLTLAWSVAADGPLITRMTIPVVCFSCGYFVDCFYHGNGNSGAFVTARRQASHSAQVSEAMCAL